MAVHIVRLGSHRRSGEGVRLGTVRRPPRGVKKGDYARLDYFDAWFPELAPSSKLVKWYHEQHPVSDKRWAQYTRMFKREMATPEHKRLLEVFAKLSHQADFSIGCYCEREDRCHRSILKELLAEQGAQVYDDVQPDPEP